jgi:MFS transporter, FSR family, fosmidomycin resistance protein
VPMKSSDGFATTLEPFQGLFVRSFTNIGAATLFLYAVAHLVVDACCAILVVGSLTTGAISPEIFASLLLLYHVIAFGLQPLLGLAVDAMGAPRLAAVLGCLISAIALLIPVPIAAIVVISLGNALFHVGGGVVCLQITPHRTTAPGLFVAPGTVGLLLGVILGKSYPAAGVYLLPFALALGALMAVSPIVEVPSVTTPRKLPHRAELMLGLILLAIAIRSLLGFLVSFPWETQPRTLLMLTGAVFLGKAVGGVFADRWGWMPVAVGAMFGALPFLALGSTFPMAAIPGLFLLNMTMPVTLVAAAEALPGRPAFAFGLTTLAILLGSLPFYFGASISGPILVSLILMISIAVLGHGLKLLAVARSLRKTLEVVR